MEELLARLSRVEEVALKGQLILEIRGGIIESLNGTKYLITYNVNNDLYL